MRGMSYRRLEELGGIQWPCYDESHPGEIFLHSRLWQKPLIGPRAPFSVVEFEPPWISSMPIILSVSPLAGGWIPSTPACRPITTPHRSGTRRLSIFRPRTARATIFAKAKKCACCRAAVPWWLRFASILDSAAVWHF